MKLYETSENIDAPEKPTVIRPGEGEPFDFGGVGGRWHTFWNAGDTPCRLIEIVSPPTLQGYFKAVNEAWGDWDRLGDVNDTYGIEINLEGVSALCDCYDLDPPPNVRSCFDFQPGAGERKSRLVFVALFEDRSGHVCRVRQRTTVVSRQQLRGANP